MTPCQSQPSPPPSSMTSPSVPKTSISATGKPMQSATCSGWSLSAGQMSISVSMRAGCKPNGATG